MQNVCPKCLTPYAPGTKFCTICGAPLPSLCPSCGKPLTPGTRFCIFCGTELTASAPGPTEGLPEDRKTAPVQLTKHIQPGTESVPSTEYADPNHSPGGPFPKTTPVRSARGSTSPADTTPAESGRHPGMPPATTPAGAGRLQSPLPGTAPVENNGGVPMRSRSDGPSAFGIPYADRPISAPGSSGYGGSDRGGYSGYDSRGSRNSASPQNPDPRRNSSRPSSSQERSTAKGGSAKLLVPLILCLAVIIGLGTFLVLYLTNRSVSGGDVSGSASTSTSTSTSSFGVSASSDSSGAGVSGSTSYVFSGGSESAGTGTAQTVTPVSFQDPNTQLEAPYSNVLRRYATGLYQAWDGNQYAQQQMSSKCGNGNGATVGYTFADLDGNGTAELLIGSMQATTQNQGEFYDLYTLTNGTPVLLAQEDFSNVWYLCTDGFLCNETTTSSGGKRTSFYDPAFISAGLTLTEAIVYDTSYSAENPWLRTTGDPETGPYSTIAEPDAQKVLSSHSHAAVPFHTFQSYMIAEGIGTAPAPVTPPVTETPVTQTPPETNVQQPTTPVTGSDSSYLMPTNTQYISRDDLYGYSKDEVTLILNEIYARHGCSFKKETFQNYFGSKSWYHPIAGLTGDTFDGSVFNDYERKNVDTIVNYMKDMGWR